MGLCPYKPQPNSGETATFSPMHAWDGSRGDPGMLGSRRLLNSGMGQSNGTRGWDMMRACHGDARWRDCWEVAFGGGAPLAIWVEQKHLRDASRAAGDQRPSAYVAQCNSDRISLSLFIHPFMSSDSKALAGNGLPIPYALDEAVANYCVLVLAWASKTLCQVCLPYECCFWQEGHQQLILSQFHR